MNPLAAVSMVTLPQLVGVKVLLALNTDMASTNNNNNNAKSALVCILGVYLGRGIVDAVFSQINAVLHLYQNLKARKRIQCYWRQVNILQKLRINE